MLLAANVLAGLILLAVTVLAGRKQPGAIIQTGLKSLEAPFRLASIRTGYLRLSGILPPDFRRYTPQSARQAVRLQLCVLL